MKKLESYTNKRTKIKSKNSMFENFGLYKILQIIKNKEYINKTTLLHQFDDVVLLLKSHFNKILLSLFLIIPSYIILLIATFSPSNTFLGEHYNLIFELFQFIVLAAVGLSVSLILTKRWISKMLLINTKYYWYLILYHIFVIYAYYNHYQLYYNDMGLSPIVKGYIVIVSYIIFITLFISYIYFKAIHKNKHKFNKQLYDRNLVSEFGELNYLKQYGYMNRKDEFEKHFNGDNND